MLESSSNLAGNLDSLLGEISILATQYKQGRQLLLDEGDCPGGVRGVLLVLGRADGRTVPEIARARGTSRQNIQIVVNRLRNDGLAELATNPTHKRSALVRLTEKGKHVLRQIELSEEKLHQGVEAALSEEDLASATKCLRRLRQLLAPGIRSDVAPGVELSVGKATAVKSSVVQAGNQVNPAGLDDSAETGEDTFPVNLL